MAHLSTQSHTETVLAEMLCTRLCHDITGPVGAIANGAEFLAEADTGMHDQAIDLITQSATEAVNRLQFYRLAYGRVNQRGEASLDDCKAVVQNFLQAGKVTLDWPDHHTDAAGIPVSRAGARLIYNMVILAVGTLIRGGTLSVRLSKSGDTTRISLAAAGPSIKWDTKIQQTLAHQVTVEALEPSTVQAYFTQVLAAEAGLTLETQTGTESFEITALMHETEHA